MAKDLSQSEIDALLTSLRRAQADAAASGAEARSEGAHPVWGRVGEGLGEALADHMARAWEPRRPGVSILQADQLPVGFSAGALWHVERLGAPLRQRLWFFWGAAGGDAAEAAEAFLRSLGARLPSDWTHQTLTPTEPFPEDGLLLPFEGVAGQECFPLTLGLEAGGLERLRRYLAQGPAEPGQRRSGGDMRSMPSTTPALRVNDLQVEVSVYVGGGVYPLSSLSALRPGAVLPLGTEVGEPAVVAIAGRVIAFGEVMVTQEDTLAVRVTRLLLGDEGRGAGPEWLEHAKRALTDASRD